jgi:hypothetical protein
MTIDNALPISPNSVAEMSHFGGHQVTCEGLSGALVISYACKPA